MMTELIRTKSEVWLAGEVRTQSWEVMYGGALCTHFSADLWTEFSQCVTPTWFTEINAPPSSF